MRRALARENLENYYSCCCCCEVRGEKKELTVCARSHLLHLPCHTWACVASLSNLKQDNRDNEQTMSSRSGVVDRGAGGSYSRPGACGAEAGQGKPEEEELTIDSEVFDGLERYVATPKFRAAFEMQEQVGGRPPPCFLLPGQMGRRASRCFPLLACSLLEEGLGLWTGLLPPWSGAVNRSSRLWWATTPARTTLRTPAPLCW